MNAEVAKKLDARSGWLTFALCWVVAFVSVWALRHAFIPADEMACYSNARVLDRSVKGWNQAHQDQVMDDKGEIDESALLSGGFLKTALSYDPQKHYYFVDRQVHGPKVKCNKHEDNPLVLKMTGVTLIALLLFVVWCSFRGYVFWKE